MQINSKPFKQIDREYIITSAELRKTLKLEGDVISIGLQKGRSPNDIEEGKSPEKDLWYINTKEVTQDVKDWFFTNGIHPTIEIVGILPKILWIINY